MASKFVPKQSRFSVERDSDSVPVPLLEPVDPDLLAQDLMKIIKEYAVLNDHQALLVGLWVTLSWCYQEFDRCPLLLINAPERACGKSQLLKIIGKLVSRPQEIANITVAGMFRTIESDGRTLLIDEADTFMEGKTELAGVINAGYDRGGDVIRMETVGKELVQKSYRVYGPKAIAGISLERHLPPTTISRGIQIVMKRKMRKEVVKRLRYLPQEVTEGLRSRLNRFVEDHREDFSRELDLSEQMRLSEELGDREQDNAEPLLVIARCLGDAWYERAKEAVLWLSAQTAEPKSESSLLLEDQRTVLADYDAHARYIASATLVQLLVENPEMDWDQYNNGRPITPRQLARLLSAYGIAPKTVRMKNGTTPKGYELRHFKEAFARYLPDEPPASTDDGAPAGPVDPPPEPDF